MTDHFLPQDLPPAAVAYIESMPPGRVELFSLAPLDRTGVACWNAIFLNQDGTRFHGVTPHGVGYGTTDAEAIIGTTGELAEAVHSAGAIARFPRRSGSYAALSAELGVRGIADPLTLCLPAGSPVDHDTVMEWVPAQRWPTGESVLVPTEIAGCSVGDFTPGYRPFTTPITNGLGAGPTLDFAIGHGICELLQRDGNGTGFRAMDRGIVLDLGDGPADPRTRALLERLAAQGIEVLPKFASDEFGVAGVYCVGGERDASAPFPIMITAAGEAASVDREQALRKALFEFAAARVRKMFSHAPLSAIAHIAPPGYLERFRSYHSLDGEESRALREMMAWCTTDGATLRSYLADTVLSRQATKRFDELPIWDGPLSGTPLVTELARRFAESGMEILFVDFSPPGARDVHVVKAIVPGLEVETMSYHRIGERGVRKLMQRGSPLVGLGAPPQGAAPVRLPAGAAERLGGPAWLDVAGIDRIVGRLYPSIANLRYTAPQSHWKSGHDPPVRLQHQRRRQPPAGRCAHPDCGGRYDGVALTLDIHHLDPYDPDFLLNTRHVAARLLALNLGCVVETGARFLLNPRAKHEPTLLSQDPEGRARRVDFLTRALTVVAETGGEAMSFWSGVPKPGVTPEQARSWLLQGVEEIVRRAEAMGVVAALEPEPGMLVETVDDWQALGIPGLKLALDTGHCLVTGERDPAVAVREFADSLGTVTIEDMKRGSHIHLPFGEGDMDVPGVLQALDAIGFRKLICVELSRESHRADVMIPASLASLRTALS